MRVTLRIALVRWRLRELTSPRRTRPHPLCGPSERTVRTAPDTTPAGTVRPPSAPAAGPPSRPAARRPARDVVGVTPLRLSRPVTAGPTTGPGSVSACPKSPSNTRPVGARGAHHEGDAEHAEDHPRGRRSRPIRVQRAAGRASAPRVPTGRRREAQLHRPPLGPGRARDGHRFRRPRGRGGAQWAAREQPGESLGFSTASGWYAPPSDAAWQLPDRRHDGAACRRPDRRGTDRARRACT